jgi:hypothetical protein
MMWRNTVSSIFNSEFLYSKQEEDLDIEKDAEGCLQPTTSSKKEVRFSSPEETSKPYVMVDIPASLEKPIPRKRKSSSYKKKRHSYPPLTMAQPMMPPYYQHQAQAYHHQAQAQFYQPPPPFCFMPPTGMGHMMAPMGHMQQAYMPQMPSAYASMPIDDDEAGWSTGDEMAA